MRKNTSTIYVIILIICAFVIGLNFEQTKFFLLDKVSSSSSQITSNSSDAYIVKNCQGLELKQTAFCLRNELSPLINYTVRNENEYVGDQGSFEEVLKNGGDCSDYNGFYVKWAKQLGFSAVEVEFPVTETTSHIYATIYSNNGYCTLDQTSIPECYEFIAQPST